VRSKTPKLGAQALKGQRIIVTSGPTQGPIDAVRFITNRSSGRLGARIAEDALKRGAIVDFVYGVDSLLPDMRQCGPDAAGNLNAFPIVTVSDLCERMRERLTCGPVAAVIHAMAVLDYEPIERLDCKVQSRENEEWVIRLRRTPKVITQIKSWNPGVILVGFKLEVHKTKNELVRIASGALIANRADMVVVNDLDNIRGEEHQAWIIGPAGQILAECATKNQIAAKLNDLIAEAVSERDGG